MRVAVRSSALPSSTAWLAPVLAALAVPACGDDDPKPADTSATTTTDTTVATDTGVDDTSVSEETTEATDTAADTDTEPVCEHPCLNAFGQNDKSLCPVPQSEWNCKVGCCEPVFKCQDDDDCAEQGFALEQCKDERFDCRCDTSTGGCFTWYCGIDDDCGEGELCTGGRCIARPSTDGLSIRILDRATVLVPDATVQLHAEAYDPADADIVLAATPTWSSSDSDVLAVDQNGLVTGGDTAGAATITATLGAETDTIVLENVLPDPTDTITVILRTEITMEPVLGDYALVNAGGVALAELPADGIIRFDGTDGPYDLHVLADGNDWVSWVGIEEGTTLYLPIPQATFGRVEMGPWEKADGSACTSGNPDCQTTIDEATSVLDGVGIVQGTPEFVSFDNEAALELILTSQGLSSALFDFSLQTLLGADVKRYFYPFHNIPRVDATEPVTLPGGIIFNLAGPAVPSFVMTLPEGHHKLWTLGGRLDLNDLAEYSGAIVDAIAGGDLDFTQIVGAVFPLFRQFRSAYVPDVAVGTVGDPGEVQTVTPQMGTPMGVFTALDVPALPQIGTLGWADGLFLIAGAQTADGFMVALGLNGGADTSDKEGNPPDGLADSNERTPEKDPFSVPIAPLHSGLQGPHTRYLVAAVAAAIPGSNDQRPSSGSATLVRTAPGEKPPAAQALPAFLAFPTEPETNKYDAAARTVDFDAVAGADVQRILFKGKRGKHWTFYGVTAGTTLVVPTMEQLGQDAAADRATGEGLDTVLINSIDFTAGVDVQTLGRPGGVALDLLLQVVARVSFVDIKRPLAEGAGR